MSIALIVILMLISALGCESGVSELTSQQIVDSTYNRPHEVISTIDVGWGAGHMCIEPSGQYVYVVNCEDSNVTVIDAIADSAIVDVFVGEYPDGICASPDGDYIYVSARYSIASISIPDNSVSHIEAMGKNYHRIFVDPSGRYAYYTATFFRNNNFDKYAIQIMDLSTGSVIDDLSIGDPGHSCVFRFCSLPSGVYIYSSNWHDKSISVIRAMDHRIIDDIFIGERPAGACITPDGQYLYVCDSHACTITVIRTSDHSVVETIPVGNGPKEVCILHPGEYAYVACGTDNTVFVISTKSNSVVYTIPVGDYPIDICASPSGDAVFVLNALSENVSVIR